MLYGRSVAKQRAANTISVQLYSGAACAADLEMLLHYLPGCKAGRHTAIESRGTRGQYLEHPGSAEKPLENSVDMFSWFFETLEYEPPSATS